MQDVRGLFGLTFREMNRIIDFHTHAFPDAIASRAMKALQAEGGITAHLDGRVSSLLDSMDRSGIERSVICSIATKPAQFDSIMSWCRVIKSERIVPFPSLHPDDPMFASRIKQIRDEGFKGVKFHPYYQDFKIDDERMFPIYEHLARENLIVLMHTGFDFAFEKTRKADPAKILKILEYFPGLKMVTTHLGAWDDWEEVERHLVGRSIYMEISFSLEYLNREKAREMILRHPAEFVLFGSDSPWTDQEKTLSLLRGLGLGKDREALILRGNAISLFDAV